MAHELVKSWAVASDDAGTLKIRSVSKTVSGSSGQAKRVEIVTAQRGRPASFRKPAPAALNKDRGLTFGSS